MPRLFHFKFSSVNLRCCESLGYRVGGTPGHLIMGGGVEKKNKKVKMQCQGSDVVIC